MRWIAFICLMVLLSACTNKYRELAHTSNSDPVWTLNDGKWDSHENNLTGPVTQAER